MKPIDKPSATPQGKDRCKALRCSQCPECSGVAEELTTPEAKGDPLQLYAREAESYFFYFDPQGQHLK